MENNNTGHTIVLSPIEQAYKGLLRYVPPASFKGVITILHRNPVALKVVNERATKLGDYRPRWEKTGKPLITINRSLNQYGFLITLVHELAHHHTYLAYGHKVKPHGEEWKQIFINLANECMLGKGFLPQDVEQALRKYFARTFASSCADVNLQRVLANYDTMDLDEFLLEKLPINTTFDLNGRMFKKGEAQRKRFKCIELKSQKIYLVSAIAKVKIIEKN